jgi:hypothetical protein
MKWTCQDRPAGAADPVARLDDVPDLDRGVLGVPVPEVQCPLDRADVDEALEDDDPVAVADRVAGEGCGLFPHQPESLTRTTRLLQMAWSGAFSAQRRSMPSCPSGPVQPFVFPAMSVRTGMADLDEDGRPMPGTLVKFLVPEDLCDGAAPSWHALQLVSERMGWD